MVASLRARGFEQISVRRAPDLAALLGSATEALSQDLGGTGVAIEARASALVPTLVPPHRRERDRLTYRVGRDVWLRVADGPVGVALRAEVARDGRSQPVEIGEGPASEVLLRVAASQLTPGANQVRLFVEGRSKALAAVEVVVEGATPESAQPRWRVTLHPTDAVVEHLRATQCWLDVEALPGVDVEVELRVGERSGARTFARDDRGVLATARWLRDAAKDLFDPEPAPGDAVQVRARPTDEPEGWSSIASLDRAEGPVRFDLSPGLPVVVSVEERPELFEVSFGPNGLERVPANDASLARPGIYLAEVSGAAAALCVCPDLRRLPSFRSPDRVERSQERSLALLSTLRAVDVATLWPESRRGAGVLLRHATVRAIERELVRTLCGNAWGEMEAELDGGRVVRQHTIARIARLLWVDPPWLADQAGVQSDPLELLPELLKGIEEPTDAPEARHLVLTFYRRGMTSPSQDDAALRWAWESVRRARAARACFLLDPEAFDERAAEAGVAEE